MLQPVVQSIEGTKALLSQRFFFCRFPAISVITATMLRPFYPSALEAQLCQQMQSSLFASAISPQPLCSVLGFCASECCVTTAIAASTITKSLDLKKVGLLLPAKLLIDTSFYFE